MEERKFYLKSVERLLAFAIAAIILYLIALNGRYVVVEDRLVLDKWKMEVYDAGSEEIPIIINGRDIYNATR